MKVGHIYWKEVILVFLTACFVLVITTVRFFAQVIRIPPNHVFIGMTHYFEDFYYYLDQFYQGAHGGWLTENRFTVENLSPTLIYFSHILLGKIGGIFGLESFTSYNLSLLILKFLFIILSYFVIFQIFPKNAKYRYFSFLIFLFSTSLPVIAKGPTGIGLYGPSRMFRTENIITARFGNVPMDYVINILFLLAILVVYHFLSYVQRYTEEKMSKQNVTETLSRVFKFILFLSLLIFILSLVDAIKSLIVIFVFAICGFLYRPRENLKKYVVLCFAVFIPVLISFLAPALYIVRAVDQDPVYQQTVQWDINEYFKQFKAYKPHDFVIAFGTLGITAIFGLPLYLKKKKMLFEKMALVIVAICFSGYFLPIFLSLHIPGFRFEFSSTYIFLASIALYGLLTIEKLFKRQILILLMVIYLVVNFTTLSLTWKEMTKIPEEPDFHFTYLPNGFYQGLLFIRNAPDKGNVLASSQSSVDLYIPGLTGRKTYSGHFLTTLNSVEKDRLAQDFLFKSSTFQNPEEFLSKNNIRFIIFTKYDGILKMKVIQVAELRKSYPFLKVPFENEMVTVFKYD